MSRGSLPSFASSDARRRSIEQTGQLRSVVLEVVQMGSLVAALLSFVRSGVTFFSVALIALALLATVLQLLSPRPADFDR